MSKLTINLFHTPLITLNGNVIHFPYKKAEAFFYYMAIEKKATREFITELLWETNDETLAKKNLRHALYTINKLFPEPIIVSPQKSTLLFVESPDILCDYDAFLKDETIVERGGLLLEGFYLKESLAFEEWLDNKQQEFGNLYLQRLRKLLFSSDETRSVEDTERLCSLYLKEDAFDEQVYKYMMEYYRDKNMFHKAINLYQDLAKILDEELGLSPSKEISALYHSLLDLWIADSSDEEPDMIRINIREQKTKQLEKTIDDFLIGKPKNTMIVGENGVGKTYLVDTVLANSDLANVLVISVTCFQSERRYALQTWNNIFLKLSDYITDNELEVPESYIEIIENFLPMSFQSDTNQNQFDNQRSYRAFSNAILKIFQLVCRETPVILFIDNINAMDSFGLDLLSRLISLQNTDLLVLLTGLSIMSYDLTTFVSQMVRANYLSMINLETLSLEQTRFFVERSLNDIKLSEQEIERFYKASNGNLFFLVEIIHNMKNHHDLNCLSSNAKEILNDRLNGITKETRQLLDIISLFENQTPFVVLEKLSSNNAQLLDNLEEAKEFSLIRECREYDEIYFSFYYHQMRDFIYEKIAPSKLRLLHGRAALALEEAVKDHLHFFYKSLAYHFSLGENHRKALYYRLLYMEQITGVYFELYPILDDAILSDEEIDLPKDINREFTLLKHELSMIHTEESAELFQEMEARLYYIRSRYYILCCDYEEALRCIQVALESNYTKGNPTFKLGLLKQLIYYCIQTCNTNQMKDHLNNALAITKKLDDTSEQAIILRLFGYYYMVTGEKKQAIASLLHSIDLIERSTIKPELYVTNIAACYNYLGEIKLRDADLTPAIEYFRKAISLCEEKSYTVNATFYTNLGKAYFFQGDYENSRANFVLAHQVYRHSTAIVGCATMHAFLAYFATMNDEYEHASHHIRMCRRMYERINSPYEKGFYYYVMSQLAESKKKQIPFIQRPANYYREQCMKYITCHDELFQIHTK